MKKYIKPVVQKLNLNDSSVFCGCNSFSSDDDSCYYETDDD